RIIRRRLLRETLSLSADEELVLTMATIHYAKRWSPSSGAAFWSFIISLYGFKDESRQLIVSVLSDAVANTLAGNSKLFIVDDGESQYKASILVHALAPTDNWIELCQFLSDFLDDNLHGSWKQGDPSVEMMVPVLSGYLNYVDETGNSLVNVRRSASYIFQEAARRLVLHRPRFATRLFEKMLARILSLRSGTALPARYRHEAICDEWWKRSSKPSGGAQAHGGERPNGVSIERLRPAYKLSPDGDVLIVFPCVRLGGGGRPDVDLAYLVDGDAVSTRPLQIVGNSLGWTVLGFEEDLGSLERSGLAMGLSPRIQIEVDGDVAYDSRETLCRDHLLFSGETERGADSCKRGEYTVVVPHGTPVSGANVEVVPASGSLVSDMHYVSLGAGFRLDIGGKPVCTDAEDPAGSLGIEIANRWPDAKYLQAGKQHMIVMRSSPLSIRVTGADGAGRLALLLNDERIEWEPVITSGDDAINAKADISGWPLGPNTMRVVDVETGASSRPCSLLIASEFSYRFNRSYYFSEGNYKGATLTCHIDGRQQQARFGMGDNFASLPHETGSIEVRIPKVHVRGSSRTWGPQVVEWSENVADETIELILPSGTRGTLFIDEAPQRLRGGRVALGRSLKEVFRSPTKERARISLLVEDSLGRDNARYPLGTVTGRECFAKSPVFWAEGKTLQWDLGGGFIGAPDSCLTLRIESDGARIGTFDLDQSDPVVTQDLEVQDGEYTFVIEKASRNVFDLTSKDIDKGQLIVGNPDELRFEGKRLIITSAFYEEGGAGLREAQLEPVYIEDIEYLGKRKSRESGIEYPCYRGTAYRLDSGGNLQAFSKKSFLDGNTPIVALNPVHLEYINDTMLYLADEEGDVPFCIRPLPELRGSKAGVGWQITHVDMGRYQCKGVQVMSPYQFSYTTDRIDNA
ncbi:MAG: hypothetical protein ACI36V_02565, partial [Coriobacteriales bacterium]